MSCLAACSTASRTGQSRRSLCKCWCLALRSAPACSCPSRRSAKFPQAILNSWQLGCAFLCIPQLLPRAVITIFAAQLITAATLPCMLGSQADENPAYVKRCEFCTGYFDAPGADVAPLKTIQPSPPVLPDVTLVFCCIEKLKEMKVQSPHAILVNQTTNL